MALSNLSFTNNLGTITLTRVMYSIAHSYSWDGSGPARAGVEIKATGTVRNSEAAFNILSTGKILNGALSRDSLHGEPGILTLPNSVLNGMRIRDITYENGVWSGWGVVTMSFSDTDDTRSSDASMELKSESGSITVYNPSIVFYPSTIRRGDTMIHGLNGWIRQQMGHEMIKIGVSGDVKTDPCTLPEDILQILEQRVSRGTPHYKDVSNYPRVASFSDFFPAAKDDFDIAQVMVEDASMTWYYEDNVADIELSMIAPPQTVLFNEEV